MRPIVNMPEEDRATDIGNMHKKLVKIAARVVLEISSPSDRDTQTDIFITILRHRSRGQSNYSQSHSLMNNDFVNISLLNFIFESNVRYGSDGKGSDGKGTKFLLGL